MNICLFNLKPGVYICQVPAEMLRLQTFRNPIPTLKEHIIQQGNQCRKHVRSTMKKYLQGEQ